MKEYIMRILVAILAVSALLAFFPWDMFSPAPDLMLTEGIDITYTEPDDSDPPKTKCSIVTVNSEDDMATIVKALTTMESSTGGNCGFHYFVFNLHIKDKTYKCSMAGDGCPLVIFRKQYYEIKEEYFMAIKALVVKYHKNVGLFSDEYLDFWANMAYRN